MSALLTLFVFGGFWFWTLVAVMSFLIILFLENDRVISTTFLVLGTFTAVVLLGNTGSITWVIEHPIKLILYGLSYCSIGVVYSILKWYLLLCNRRSEYKEYRVDWLNGQISKDTPKKQSYQAALTSGIMVGRYDPAIKELWLKHLDDRAYYNNDLRKPLAKDNKSRITGWMMYWPWSCLWTILNDPIRKLFTYLYKRISGLLQVISDYVYKEIDEELK